MIHRFIRSDSDMVHVGIGKSSGDDIILRYFVSLSSFQGTKFIILADDGFGGAKEDRTPDLLLARQALSQLSYGPIWDIQLAFSLLRESQVVGPSGLEPPTSPLSGVRSNQLS